TQGIISEARIKLISGIPQALGDINVSSDLLSLPEVLETSNEHEWTWNPGKEFFFPVKISMDIETIIEPRKSVKISLLTSRLQMNVPWTARIIYSVDNREVLKPIRGEWRGTIFYNTRVKVERLYAIPPAILLKMIPADFANLKVAFRTFHGNYLRAATRGFVNTADVIREWEHWIILPLDPRETIFRIRSIHNKYLTAHGSYEGAAEHDLWSIQSVEHGTYIHSGKNDMHIRAEYWERYSIVVLSEPIMVRNLEYQFEKAEKIIDKPLTISSTTLINDHDKEVKRTDSIREQIGRSFMFIQTQGIISEARIKLISGIPQALGDINVSSNLLPLPAGLETSSEHEWTWTPGNEIFFPVKISMDVETIIEPKKSVKISLLTSRLQMNVPWTARVVYSVDKREVLKTIKGEWKGTIFYNTRVKIENLNGPPAPRTRGEPGENISPLLHLLYSIIYLS
ncbi:16181_t:CDS:2, partial [Acaulospora morrowiae]